jgi:hypothetical protein
MENVARNSPARRFIQYMAKFLMLFVVSLGGYELLEYLWPPPQALWKSVLFAAVLAAVFAAKLPPLRKARLGGPPRS